MVFAYFRSFGFGYFEVYLIANFICRRTKLPLGKLSASNFTKILWGDELIETELLYSDAPESPRRRDESIKHLYVVRLSKVTNFTTIPRQPDSNGGLLRVHYEVRMVSDGASLYFAVTTRVPEWPERVGRLHRHGTISQFRGGISHPVYYPQPHKIHSSAEEALFFSLDEIFSLHV